MLLRYKIKGVELDALGYKTPPRGFHWLQGTDTYKRTTPLDVLRRLDHKWIRPHFFVPPEGGVIGKRYFTRAGAERAATPGTVVKNYADICRVTGGSRSPFKP